MDFIKQHTTIPSLSDAMNTPSGEGGYNDGGSPVKQSDIDDFNKKISGNIGPVFTDTTSYIEVIVDQSKNPVIAKGTDGNAYYVPGNAGIKKPGGSENFESFNTFTDVSSADSGGSNYYYTNDISNATLSDAASANCSVIYPAGVDANNKSRNYDKYLIWPNNFASCDGTLTGDFYADNLKPAMSGSDIRSSFEFSTQAWDGHFQVTSDKDSSSTQCITSTSDISHVTALVYDSNGNVVSSGTKCPISHEGNYKMKFAIQQDYYLKYDTSVTLPSNLHDGSGKLVSSWEDVVPTSTQFGSSPASPTGSGGQISSSDWHLASEEPVIPNGDGGSIIGDKIVYYCAGKPPESGTSTVNPATFPVFFVYTFDISISRSSSSKSGFAAALMWFVNMVMSPFKDLTSDVFQFIIIVFFMPIVVTVGAALFSLALQILIPLCQALLRAVLIIFLKALDNIQSVIQMLTGVKTITYYPDLANQPNKSKQMYLLNVLLRDANINQWLWRITLVAFILTFIFTIYALLRNMVAAGQQPKSVGQILWSAFRSGLSFLVVPVVLLAGIQFVSIAAGKLLGSSSGGLTMSEIVYLVTAMTDTDFVNINEGAPDKLNRIDPRIYPILLTSVDKETRKKFDAGDVYTTLMNPYGDFVKNLIKKGILDPSQTDPDKIDDKASLLSAYENKYDNSMNGFDAAIHKFCNDCANKGMYYAGASTWDRAQINYSSTLIERVNEADTTIGEFFDSPGSFNSHMSGAVERAISQRTQPIYENFQILTDCNAAPSYVGFLDVSAIWNFLGMIFFFLLAGIFTFFGLYIFISIALACVKRIFDILMLYLISPFFAASIPLDDGEHFKQWSEFIFAATISCYSVLLAVNIFFALVPLIMSPRIVYFQGGTANFFLGTVIKIVFLFGGLSSASRADTAIMQMINWQVTPLGASSTIAAVGKKVKGGLQSAISFIPVAGPAISGVWQKMDNTFGGDDLGQGGTGGPDARMSLNKKK
jgi:hypothetical protein